MVYSKDRYGWNGRNGKCLFLRSLAEFATQDLNVPQPGILHFTSMRGRYRTILFEYRFLG